MKNVIYSIGTSRRKKEDFINILKSYNVEVVVDVRRFPTSQFWYFKKENLRLILEEEGIRYEYFGDELGGYRKEGYIDYMSSLSFKKGIEAIENLAKEKTVCILCAELFVFRCHRRFIAKALKKHNWEIIHIINK